MCFYYTRHSKVTIGPNHIKIYLLFWKSDLLRL